MRYIFVVLLVVFRRCSSEESIKELQICNQTFEVDSIGRPFGTNFVYLISSESVFKLELVNDSYSVINSSQKLKDWDPSIKPPINMIYITKVKPKQIFLINCELRKEWTIDYENNHYIGSTRPQNLCGYEIEYITDPETGDQFVLQYVPMDTQLIVINSFYNKEWNIRGIENEIKALSSREDSRGTESFYKLNGSKITAAFIHDGKWYLFGGRYYCSVSLNTWEECKPVPISHWIKDCSQELLSKTKPIAENKDISIYVVIVVAIIAVTLISIVVITILTCKEYKKRGTYLNQSSTTQSFSSTTGTIRS